MVQCTSFLDAFMKVQYWSIHCIDDRMILTLTFFAALCLNSDSLSPYTSIDTETHCF